MREQERLSRLKLVVLDVDGTLTDGRIIYGNDGMEMKQFHVRDGAGILLAQNAGLEFMCRYCRFSSNRIFSTVRSSPVLIVYTSSFSTCFSSLFQYFAIGRQDHNLPRDPLAAVLQRMS